MATMNLELADELLQFYVVESRFHLPGGWKKVAHSKIRAGHYPPHRVEMIDPVAEAEEFRKMMIIESPSLEYAYDSFKTITFRLQRYGDGVAHYTAGSYLPMKLAVAPSPVQRRSSRPKRRRFRNPFNFKRERGKRAVGEK